MEKQKPLLVLIITGSAGIVVLYALIIKTVSLTFWGISDEAMPGWEDRSCNESEDVIWHVAR